MLIRKIMLLVLSTLLYASAIMAENPTSTNPDSFYEVTTTAGTGTVIYPASAGVKEGGVTTFRVTLQDGYENFQVSGCDGVLNGDVYYTAPVNSTCSISSSATRIAAQYNVYIDIPEGFTAAPLETGSFDVNAGETVSVRLTATSNRRISGVNGNGGAWDGQRYVSAPILKNTSLWFYSEEVTDEFKVWNIRVTPNALWHEDVAITPVCFEADVTGNFISMVMSPAYGVQVPMYDDGTHCDKIVGDGVYSVDYIHDPDLYNERLRFAGGTIGGNWAQFHGLGTDGELLYSQGDALSRNNGTNVFWVLRQYEVEADTIAPGVQKTPHALFFEQTDLVKDGRYPRLTKDYVDTMFGDNRFDFQVNYQIGAQYAGVYPIQSFHRSRSDAYGIGLDNFVRTEEEAGRLLGHIYLSTGIGTVYALSHEFLHAWTHFLNNPLLDLQRNTHNILCNTIGGVVGTTFAFMKNDDGFFLRNPDMRSPGSYGGPASALELYLAGLLPLEDLPKEMYFYRKDAAESCLNWGDTPIPESEFFRVIPQDIVDVYGERSRPDGEQSRKNFHTVFVAVSDRVITNAEKAVIERAATYYGSTDSLYENESYPPFYWMARQRGTMTTAIPVAVVFGDTDGDGVLDTEDAFPNDPLEWDDSDSDGLGDNKENKIGTHPNKPDTDSDGYSDKEEYAAGSDPLDPTNVPVARGLNIILIKAAMDAEGD